MQRYHGRRRGGHRLVWVEGPGSLYWLRGRRDLWDHSDTLDWGLGADDAAAAQLALALLADAAGDAEAVRCYLDFARDQVSLWGDSWDTTEGRIRDWIRTARP